MKRERENDFPLLIFRVTNKLKTYRESSNFDKFRDEMAAKMQSNKRFQAAEASATDENSRRRTISNERRGRNSGDFIVIVNFDDSGMDADDGEKSLHDVAHTARGTTEYDHRMLCNQPPDPSFRRLIHVDG